MEDGSSAPSTPRSGSSASLALLGLVVLRPNPILIIILIFSGMELWQRWRHAEPPGGRRPTTGSHRGERVTIAVLYFGLAVLLVLGMNATHVDPDRLR